MFKPAKCHLLNNEYSYTHITSDTSQKMNGHVTISAQICPLIRWANTIGFHDPSAPLKDDLHSKKRTLDWGIFFYLRQSANGI